MAQAGAHGPLVPVPAATVLPAALGAGAATDMKLFHELDFTFDGGVKWVATDGKKIDFGVSTELNPAPGRSHRLGRPSRRRRTAWPPWSSPSAGRGAARASRSMRPGSWVARPPGGLLDAGRRPRVQLRVPARHRLRP